MNTVIENPAEVNVPTREQIEALQKEVMAMPQIEPITEHYFSDGMYCRKVWRPAGTVVIGKVHKKDHFFMCVKGELLAWSETGMRHLKEGDVICSKPGTKRVTFALTDAIGLTVHKTDKTDLDAIEEELIEPETMSLFDSDNKLKDKTLAHKVPIGELL